jgi:GNAT superfamily N-acetyltransferase
MMQEHQEFDPRIHLADGAETAYRAYLGYHLSQADSRVGVACVEAPEGRLVAGFYLAIVNRNLPMFMPPEYGYLSDLAVLPPYRRRGIGRALVGDLRQWLRSRKNSTIQLQYYVRNERPRAFWNSLGFQPYYERMWLDID